MLAPIAKLLCATAFAGVALAQSISIKSPAPGASLQAGAALTIELEKSASTTTTDEVAFALGFTSCGGPCSGTVTDLGGTTHQGAFSAQWTDSAGNQYANVTVDVPTYINGPTQINFLHLYLSGAYGTPKLEYATAAVSITGGEGR